MALEDSSNKQLTVLQSLVVILSAKVLANYSWEKNVILSAIVILLAGLWTNLSPLLVCCIFLLQKSKQ